MKPTLLDVVWDDSQTVFELSCRKMEVTKDPVRFCAILNAVHYKVRLPISIRTGDGRHRRPAFYATLCFVKAESCVTFFFISILRTVGGPGRLWSVAERRAVAWSCELTVKSHVTITTNIRPSKALHHLRLLFRKRDTQVFVYNEDLIVVYSEEKAKHCSSR